jgi:hypothetical protein
MRPTAAIRRARFGRAKAGQTRRPLREHGYWADRAPTTDARITLAIRGKLATVSWNGVLAYLVMCDAPGLQVVCVTYQTNGMQAGDVVIFGGGYERRGPKHIVMDPCLASRE